MSTPISECWHKLPRAHNHSNKFTSPPACLSVSSTTVKLYTLYPEVWIYRGTALLLCLSIIPMQQLSTKDKFGAYGAYGPRGSNVERSSA